MPKKAVNFKSKQAEQNWVKAVHSIPSKSKPGMSVAEASPGNTPLKVNGKSVVVDHKKATPKKPTTKPTKTTKKGK